MKPLLDALGPAANLISGTFECAAIAERMLASSRLPKKKRDALFLHLSPKNGFAVRAKGLYEHHVRELVERCRKGEDLRPGTEAEVVILLSESSLASPLVSRATALYERLFERIFPERARELFQDGYRTNEPWERATDELLHELRTKLAQPERRMA